MLHLLEVNPGGWWAQNTYIENSSVSSVFGIIDTPLPPLHPASVSSPRGEGWEVNIWEDARHWIGLFQYIPLRWWVWVPIEEKDLEPKSPGLPNMF
jgi:hypothetical protein